jgi:metal-responsive CopG/Arc/MetJ family transcriptional regulator
MAINQKAISAKINLDIYDELEAEVRNGLYTRNGLINQAIRHYLVYLDTVRQSRCIGTPGDREGLVLDYIDRHFPHWRQ